MRSKGERKMMSDMRAITHFVYFEFPVLIFYVKRNFEYEFVLAMSNSFLSVLNCWGNCGKVSFGTYRLKRLEII